MIKYYILGMTGLSARHFKRLVKKKKQCGQVAISPAWGKKNRFKSVYTPEDIALLVETDNLHERPCGQTTKAICRRQHEEFRDKRFIRLKDISVSHIYNLRTTRYYTSKTTTFTHTQARSVEIGLRKKPEAQGKPGYLRVDSVHQGDFDTGLGSWGKGVYHINFVDEQLQWEVVVCVERRSEQFLKPVFEQLQEMFPFKLLNFHSDNGSEYINYLVADILNRLSIQQTKSRSRHSNDNALVEGKNGSIIRKHIGYRHIPQSYAETINQFYQDYFNTYLNFHRPCGFATVTQDAKGKQTKKYDIYLIPYQKLQTLENFTQYLVPGWTKERLDAIAYTHSDNEWARLMQQAKRQLFKQLNINQQPKMTVSV